MADEFDTDKGVKDDYDGVIIDAYFRAGENNPDSNLVLKKKADDGEEVEDFYRVGVDWASFDGGQTVEHPTKSKIRADSQLAILTERAMASGAEAVIRERSSASGGLGHRTAALWPGLRFHWDVEAKPYSFKDRDGNQVDGVSYKSYPSRFLGVQESLPDQPQESAADVIPPEVEAKLKVLAATKSFSDWVDEALSIDWVRDNMLSALSDEGFYNSLKGSA